MGPGWACGGAEGSFWSKITHPDHVRKARSMRRCLLVAHSWTSLPPFLICMGIILFSFSRPKHISHPQPSQQTAAGSQMLHFLLPFLSLDFVWWLLPLKQGILWYPYVPLGQLRNIFVWQCVILLNKNLVAKVRLKTQYELFKMKTFVLSLDLYKSLLSFFVCLWVGSRKLSEGSESYEPSCTQSKKSIFSFLIFKK